MGFLPKMTSFLAIATVAMATGSFFVTSSHKDSALHHTYANYSGDLLLSGFFPIHQSGKAAKGNVCGKVQEQDGIQALEMFFYTLDEINNKEFFPNFTLGAVAFDSCDDELYALQQGVDLVAVLMSRTGYNQNSYVCEDGSKPAISPSARDLHKVFSIVGGSSSAVTLSLASFFALFNIPQISYLATTSDLSNQERYPHFKRTVPSDSIQARAIITLLKSFNWTYVSVIYEDTNYGIKGYAELEKWGEEEGICLASTNRLDFNHPTWSDSDYDAVIKSILEEEEARVVVLYVDWARAKKIFEAAARNNVGNNITWVGSDAWSGRSAAVEGFEEIADGAITLQPYAYINPEFDTYFKGLNLNENERNPWFDEFWESHFNCNIDYDLLSILNCDKTGCKKPNYDDIMQSRILQKSTIDNICTGFETIGENSGYYQQNYLHFISDAVLAYAHALKDIHRDLCGQGYVGLCPEMAAVNLTGDIVTSYLNNLTFTASSGVPFEFYNKIDGPPRYTILNYLYNSSSQTGTWTEVGGYSGNFTGDGVTGEHQLTLHEDFIIKMENSTNSVCSLPCEIGQATQFVQPWDLCCWVCVTCNDDEIVITSPIGDVCRPCGYGLYPDESRMYCEEIPLEFLSYSDGPAIGAMIFAIVGILATTFTFLVFIVYGSTPVVKASGRELSFYLLAAITLAFSSTFLIVHRPTDIICGATRVLIGLCFTMIYASILTKTNRISRIFNSGGQKGKRAKYTSPKSQIIIVNILVFVELLVLTSWLIASPPGVTHVYPHRLANVLVCAGEEGATYLIGLIYPAILLLCCTVYAFRTRKTPDGFNETKHVGIVSYTTLVILFALIPVYFLTNDPGIKTIAICFTLSLTGSAVLCCIFVPKIYICLFRANKNTKEAIMQRTTSVLSSVSLNSFNENSRSRNASCSFCGKDGLTEKDASDYKAMVLSPDQLADNPDVMDQKFGVNNNNKSPDDKNDDGIILHNDNVITSQRDINTVENKPIKATDITKRDKRNSLDQKDEKPLVAPPRKRHSNSSVTFAEDVDIISETGGAKKESAPIPTISSTPIPTKSSTPIPEESEKYLKATDKTESLKTSNENQQYIDEDSGIVDEQVDITFSEYDQSGRENTESLT